ncbi:metal ABC transporter permease [Caldichromatium japonicum]|uniref:Metal ABC transporter permease n=1 Tax=Caldichromatium japonicum TaxID=2699430 RepID=A0A6G7VCX5_9GAMM|nr:metal ABC transporter permease [Caldichromatium japonicum]QIK37726.1 metal ABC transporter permease [Caldichromatium japonicum]
MPEFIAALSAYAFLQKALIAGLLASIGCGLIGPFVVVKRIAFMAGGIAHAVLGGMGAAIYLGFDPLLGAIIASLVSAVLMGMVRLAWQAQEDTLISALWAVGMAIGLLFIAKTPGYRSDLMGLLFGNILLVPDRALIWMAGLDLLVGATIATFYRPLLALTFDEEFARLRGVPVAAFYLLLLCLVALTAVLLIQVVGLILVIALLTLPAAIAGHYIHSLESMMLIATLLGMLFTSLGLALSFAPDLPAGPTMILLAGAVYILSALFSQWLRNRRARRLTGSGGT